jgi:hypothetical protein
MVVARCPYAPGTFVTAPARLVPRRAASRRLPVPAHALQSVVVRADSKYDLATDRDHPFASRE